MQWVWYLPNWFWFLSRCFCHKHISQVANCVGFINLFCFHCYTPHCPSFFLSHLLFGAPLHLLALGGKKADKPMFTRIQRLIRFKFFPFLRCLHFLQGRRHLKPEEWLSSCGISVISQPMQEVLFWAWGPSQKPNITLNDHLPASCYIRPCRASLMCLVGLTCLRAGSMFVGVSVHGVGHSTLGASQVAVHSDEGRECDACNASFFFSYCTCWYWSKS